MELTPCGYESNQHFTEEDFYAFCDYVIKCAKVFETKTGIYRSWKEDNDYTIFELVKIMYRRYSNIEKYEKDPLKIKIAKKNKKELEHFMVSSIKYDKSYNRPQIVVNIEAKNQIIKTYHAEHNIDENYIKTGYTKQEAAKAAKEMSESLDL